MAKLTLEQVINIVNREEEIANKEYYIAKTLPKSSVHRKCRYDTRKKWQEKLTVAMSLARILDQQYWDSIKKDFSYDEK
jgi:hypothetical protein